MRDITEEKQRLRESSSCRQLAARVQTAREEERANLAELHDELGQTLAAIKLELSGRRAPFITITSTARPSIASSR
jgi:signal transduction histidine kinase